MKTILVMIVVVASAAVFVARAAADEHSGTWKLNPAKSTFCPGPGMRNLTETISLDENSYNVDANGTGADGTPVHIVFSARCDGKAYPMAGVLRADTVTVKWIDAHTPQMIQKKGGEVTMTITCKVSTDGKTRRCTLKGRDARGRKVSNVVVFDRQ